MDTMTLISIVNDGNALKIYGRATVRSVLK